MRPRNLKVSLEVFFGGNVISDSTHVLAESTTGVLESIAEDGSTFNFSESTPELQALFPGDVFVRRPRLLS